MGPNFADSITPQGLVNGANTVFLLPNIPNPSLSLQLKAGGVTQSQVAEPPLLQPDYVLSGNKITFTVAPIAGTMLLAWYRF